MNKQFSKNNISRALWICMLILGIAQGSFLTTGSGNNTPDTIGSPGEIGPESGEPIPYLTGRGGVRIDGNPLTDDPEERSFYLDNTDPGAECDKIVYVLNVKLSYSLEPEDGLYIHGVTIDHNEDSTTPLTENGEVTIHYTSGEQFRFYFTSLGHAQDESYAVIESMTMVDYFEWEGSSCSDISRLTGEGCTRDLIDSRNLGFIKPILSEQTIAVGDPGDAASAKVQVVATEPDPKIFTPGSLAVVANRAGQERLQVIRDANRNPRQLITQKAILDIVTLDPYGYEIRTYPSRPALVRSGRISPDTPIPQPSGKGARTAVQPVIGEPTEIIRIENPDRDNTGDHIRIMRIVGKRIRVNDYTWDDQNQAWELDNGDFHTEVTTQNIPVLNETTKIYRIIDNTTHEVLHIHKNVYDLISPENPLIRQTHNPGHPGERSTTYNYEDDPLNAAYMKITEITGENGETILIGYDGEGRPLVEHRGRDNRLGGTTRYTQSSSSTMNRIMTTTYPDGGNREEHYYLDGNLHQISGDAAFGKKNYYSIEYIDNEWRTYTWNIKQNDAGQYGAEWTRTYKDMLGHDYLTTYNDPSYNYPRQTNYYNNQGQLIRQEDPDGVTTLYGYNAKGELNTTAYDMNNNDTIDPSGNDRITTTDSQVFAADHADNPLDQDAIRTRTLAYDQNNSTSTKIQNETWASTDGLTILNRVYKDPSTPVDTVTRKTYTRDTNGNIHGWTHTTTRPDGTRSVQTYQQGRLLTTATYDSSPTPNRLTQTTYEYDSHGRQHKMIDARNGTTQFAYNNADLVTTVTTPSPDGNADRQVTTTEYDTNLRPIKVIHPDGGEQLTTYYPNGLVKKIHGDRTYPVEYTYDSQGRMKTMTTWKNHSGDTGKATTTWNYDPYRGWLTSKAPPTTTTAMPATKAPPTTTPAPDA